MMLYTIDCEFNGYCGSLISMAIIREDGASLYLVRKMDELNDLLCMDELDPWVATNVLPILYQCPVAATILRIGEFSGAIEVFLHGDDSPIFISDWPDDIKYLCEMMSTGPGEAIRTSPIVQFMFVRVDAYPTTLEGAVQHNAYWDAKALEHKLQNTKVRELRNA